MSAMNDVQHKPESHKEIQMLIDRHNHELRTLKSQHVVQLTELNKRVLNKYKNQALELEDQLQSA